MKVLLALCLALSAYAGPARAVDVPLRWIPPPDPDVNGYKVYLGSASGAYADPIDVASTWQDPQGLVLYLARDLDRFVRYYAAVSAYDTSGNESTLSNEINFMIGQCTIERCGQEGCYSPPLPDGTACDDGDPSTIDDACSQGVCQGQGPACRSDSDCSDGDRCNGSETCVGHRCVAGAPLRCPASTQCMPVACDPALGCVVDFSPAGTPCDDGDDGTVSDQCSGGVCVGEPLAQLPAWPTLEHLWMFGFEESVLARDYGESLQPLDVLRDAAGISAQDVVVDPGGGWLDLDGATEHLGSAARQWLDIAGNWTISAWIEPDTLGGASQVVFGASRDGSGADLADLIVLEVNASGYLQPQIFDENGDQMKNLQYAGLVEGQWNQVAVTLSQDAVSGRVVLRTYVNGVLEDPVFTAVDRDGSMTNSPRHIAIGVNNDLSSSHFDGRIHSLALWDQALDPAQVEALWAGGQDRLGLPAGGSGYTSAGNLRHWWRMEEVLSGIHADHGNGSWPVDVSRDAAGISAADVVVDPSGGWLDLDGATESLGNATRQWLDIAGDWTISAWIEPETLGGASQVVFGASRDSSGADLADLIVLEVNASGYLQPQVFDENGDQMKNLHYAGLVEGQWNQVVVTLSRDAVSGRAVLRTYINGVLEDPVLTAVDRDGSMTNSPRHIAIGVNNNFSNGHFDGRIHSLALWDQALDPAQVEALYNHGDRTLDLLQ